MSHESWPTNPAYIQLHPCSSSAKETSKAQRQRDGAVFVLQLPASRSRAEAAAGCRCWQPEKVSWNSLVLLTYTYCPSESTVAKGFFLLQMWRQEQLRKAAAAAHMNQPYHASSNEELVLLVSLDSITKIGWICRSADMARSSLSVHVTNLVDAR